MKYLPRSLEKLRVEISAPGFRPIKNFLLLFPIKIVRNGEHYFNAKYRICSDYELNDFFYIWEEAATGRCYLYFEGKERKLVIINLSLIFFLVGNFLIDIIYYSIGLAFLLNKIIWTVRLIKWSAAIVEGVYLNLWRMELICMSFMHNQSYSLTQTHSKSSSVPL